MKTILAFGDSNLYGADAEKSDAPRLDYHERFCGILQQNLGQEVRVVEDALPGRTAMLPDPLTADRRGYEQLRLALEIHAPVDLLILHLGTNELRPMFGLSAEMIAVSVQRLVTLARTSEFKARRVLLLAPHPLLPDYDRMRFGFLFSPGGYEKSCALAKAYEQAARAEGADFFDCGSLKMELNQIDGIHYNRRDIRRLADKVTELAREILAQ